MRSYTDCASDIQSMCQLANTRFTVVPVSGLDGIVLEFPLAGDLSAPRLDLLYNKTTWDTHHLHGLVVDFRHKKLCVRLVRDANKPAFVPLVNPHKLDMHTDNINSNDEQSVTDTVCQGMRASADGIVASVEVEERATEYGVFITGLRRVTHYALANSGMGWIYDVDKGELRCSVAKRNGRKRQRE